jgi:hypothetical protein
LAPTQIYIFFQTQLLLQRAQPGRLPPGQHRPTRCRLPALPPTSQHHHHRVRRGHGDLPVRGAPDPHGGCDRSRGQGSIL